MQALIIMFFMGSSFAMLNPAKTKQDTWITFVLGAVMEIPLIFMYCAVLRKYPNQNFYEMIQNIFGKIIGKAICLLYVWYSIHLGSMVLRRFSEFIHILNMAETPVIFAICLMCLLVIYAVKKGPENMGRTAKTTFLIFACSIIITVIISIKNMDFSVLQPAFSTDIKAILDGSFTMLTLPYSEVIVCLPLFVFLKPKEKPSKVMFISLAAAALIFTLAHLRNIMVLGLPNTEKFYFSSYQAVSLISIGDFLTRIEVLVGVSELLTGFIKICISLYSASAGLAHIFNIKDYKRLTVPCALILMLISVMQYRSATDMFIWIKYLPYYAIPFNYMLPVIIFIAAEIKGRKKKENALPQPENMGTLE